MTAGGQERKAEGTGSGDEWLKGHGWSLGLNEKGQEKGPWRACGWHMGRMGVSWLEETRLWGSDPSAALLGHR